VSQRKEMGMADGGSVEDERKEERGVVVAGMGWDDER
jgi:hypothetical protein